MNGITKTPDQKVSFEVMDPLPGVVRTIDTESMIRIIVTNPEAGQADSQLLIVQSGHDQDPPLTSQFRVKTVRR